MKFALLALSVLAMSNAFGAEASIGAPDCLVINARPVPKESVTWSGPCKDGYADGVGTLTWFVDGKSTSSYEGSMVRGRADGDGYAQDANGTQYEGGMRHGQRHGKGTALTIDRSRYDGQWKDGKKDGSGTETFATGGRYEGQWKDGRFHGKGKATYIGGRVFEGEFQDGLPLGMSVLKSAMPTGGYRLKSDSAEGGKFRHTIVSGGPAPFDKSYAQMTAQEQQGVRSLLPMLHPDDAPPYPLKGMAALNKMLSEAHYEIQATGLLVAHVTVDGNGAATAVQVFKSPSPAMTAVITVLLLKEKFTPGLCAGTPCPMAIPFRIQFGAPST